MPSKVAAKTMIGTFRQTKLDVEITLGADKGYDAKEFVAELHRLKVQPHVAQNTSRRRTAVSDEIAPGRWLRHVDAMPHAH